MGRNIPFYLIKLDYGDVAISSPTGKLDRNSLKVGDKVAFKDKQGNELFGENLIARQRGQLEGRGTSMALCAEPLALCFVLLKGCGLSLCTLIPLGRENPTGT